MIHDGVHRGSSDKEVGACVLAVFPLCMPCACRRPETCDQTEDQEDMNGSDCVSWKACRARYCRQVGKLAFELRTRFGPFVLDSLQINSCGEFLVLSFIAWVFSLPYVLM